MAKTRRVVRKLEPWGEPSFDERLWPVNLALVLLGSFLIGIDLAYLSFQDPRWYANAAFWLVAIPMSIATVMLLLKLTSSRALRRTMQLALVISLLLHLIFVLVMVNVAIFSRTQLEEPLAQVTERREEVVVPEYFLETTEEDQPKQDFEKPVATETPQSEVQLERSEATPSTALPELQPVPVPEPEITLRPQAVRRNPDAETVPRRSQDLSQLSRQEPAHLDLSDPQVPAPLAAPIVPRTAPDVQPAPSTPTRQPAAVAARERSNFEPATSSAAGELPSVPREVTEQAPELVQQAPAVDRQPSESDAAARSEIEAPRVPAIAQQTQPEALRPQNASADRQATAAPVERRTLEPLVQTPAEIRRQEQLPRERSEPQPIIAQTPDPLPIQQPRLTTRPDSVAAELPSTAPQTTAGADQPALAASAAQASRQATSIEHQPTDEADATPRVAVSPEIESERAESRDEPELAILSPPPQMARDSPAPQVDNIVDAPAAPASDSVVQREQTLEPLSSGLTGRDSPLSAPAGALRSNSPSAEPPSVSVTPSIATRQQVDRQEPTVASTAGRISRDDTIPSPSGQTRVEAEVPQVAVDETRADPVANLGAIRSPASRSLAPTPDAGPAAERGVQVRPESTGRLVEQMPIGRAEAASGSPGPPIPGGGDVSPARAARGPELAADATAEVPELVGNSASTGSPRRMPLAAQGFQSERLLGGLAELPRRELPEGPSADRVAPAGIVRIPEAAVERRTPAAGEMRPRFDDVARGTVPRQSSEDAQLSPGDVAQPPVDVPAVAARQGREQPDLTALEAPRSGEPVLRESDSAVAVDIASPEGPGGLGRLLASNAGITSRRAQSESLQVEPRPARFRRDEVGGPLETSTAAVIPAEAFRRRAERDGQSGRDGGQGQPGPETEAAIELGLAFLQRQQRPDGSWTLRGYDEEVALASDTAATGLALLAFQGAGYNHREHRYAEAVAAGLDYLISIQKENGDLYRPLDEASNSSVWLYSHSIAALALCEAYGMTQDPLLREPAQRSLDFIVAAQHDTRGGWRYLPNYGSDTSVSGWMTMALKSGELANLEVPTETYANIEHWLDLAQVSRSQAHLYRYNPYAPDTLAQRHGRLATPSMTAVGLLMRLYTGWRRDHPDFAKGATYLLDHMPAYGTVSDPQRDTYYWYYATQVMFHMGGTHWQQWNERLHPLLADTQVKQGPLTGSWDPRTPVPDRWGPHAGRIYVTTMNLLSLEVYYRHLPLYEDTAR